MPEQRRNSAMISTLGGEFQRRYEAAFAWKSACSAFLALLGLRGFWPMSAFNENGDASDQSGQGRVLTANSSPKYNYYGLAPYIDLDGGADYLSRTDEAGLDILGTEGYVAPAARGLTLGGWFWLDVAAATRGLISKVDNPNDWSYWLEYDVAANRFSFRMTPGGVLGGIVVVNSTVTVNTSRWYFICGRFDPSTEMAIFVNDTKTTNVAAIPAAIHSGIAPLIIGALDPPGLPNYLDGRASLCFLCAAALSDAIIMSLYHQTRAAFGI